MVQLPNTLDETYERTLLEISEENWELAHRMFQFVSVASRPLHVNDLAYLLAFDFKAGSIPEFHKDWPLEDPAFAVLSTCSTLFVTVNEGSPVIKLSHFSVKEFLTSTRLAEATDIISRRYHVSMTPAHTLVAQACLSILLHLDKDVTSDNLKDFPLAEYAAEHWVDHARFEDVSRNVEDGIKRLLDPSKPHLAICIWIYDPGVPRWKQNTRNETPLPLPRTSLHYAASWGLHPVVVESLIIEHSQDVCSRDSTDNATPLHLASLNGHLKAVCKLIECGADATAQNNDGETSLHLALRWGRVDVARMLIARCADLSTQNNDGETPLHLALRKNQEGVARVLIERGADLSTQNNHGETPLHLALKENQEDVARMLIERGADLTAQNYVGNTPLHLSLRWGQVDLARMLIACSADLSIQNSKGETPLHVALKEEQDDVARMLIERDANVTVQNNLGDTPLHITSRWGQVDLTRMLIERDANVTAQNKVGDTPLHLALASPQWISPRKYAEVVRMLLEHDADVNARNANGLTPFILALQCGLAKIIHVLVQHGVDCH